MSGVNFTANPTLMYVVVGLVILALIAVIVWAELHKKRKRERSLRLQQRFGPEYERMVGELGNRDKAEAELAAREKRVDRLHIVPLSSEDAARFGQAWNALQSRFVDDPKGAAVEADRLVYELMSKRGYPMGDFERRAADISVDHPVVVVNYRAARAIAVRGGQASTEDLRKAVVHYRGLFRELLDVQDPTAGPTVAPKPVGVA